MAVIANQNQNTQDPNNQQQGNVAGPVNVSGASSTSQDTNSPKSTPSNNYNPNAPTSSGRFTNLTNYIKANSDTNLAGQMQGQFQNQYDTLNNQSTQGKNDFYNQANQGRNQYDNSFVQNAVNDPTAYAGDDSNNQKFQQQRTGQYTGPQGINNSTQMQNDAQNFKQMGDQTNTEQGRFALLKNMYDNANYSTGQQSLDNLLLQSNPDQLQQLAQYRGMANSLNNNINSNINQAATDSQNYKNEALATNQQTQNALTGGFNNFTQGLDNQVTQQQTANTQLQNDLNSGKLTQAEATQLGLTPDMIKQYNQVGAGLPITNYFKTINPTEQNVASQQDVDKYNALNKLAGTTGSLFGDASQIGTAYKNPLNTSQFQQDLGATQQAYNSDTTPIQQALNGDTNLANFHAQRSLDDMLSNIAGSVVGTSDTSSMTPDQLQQYNDIMSHYSDQAESLGRTDASSLDNWKNTATPNQFQSNVDWAIKNGYLNADKYGYNADMSPESDAFANRQDYFNNINAANTQQQALQNLINKYGAGTQLQVT